MEITAESVSKEDIPERAERSGKWADFVRSVKESGKELPLHINQNVVNEFGAKQVSSSLRNALKNAKISGLKVQQRNNEVYLVSE